MGKFQDFLEQKSYLMMTICMIIQGVLFTLFTVLFLLENNSHTFQYKIYICGSMCLFFIFMIHFAYHSVRVKIPLIINFYNLLHNQILYLDPKSLFYRINRIFTYVYYFLCAFYFQLLQICHR